MNTKPPKIEARCNHCGQNFMQSRKIAVKNKRLGFNSYCSKKCQSSGISNKIDVKCQVCNKKLKRCPSEINKNIFCSYSCSSKFHNQKRREARPKKICQGCNSEILSAKAKKYCSQQCWANHQTIKRIESGKFYPTTAKKYLVSIKNECSICGLKSTWNNKNLVMVLDHIDGNSNNNDLSNLRLVCPNCDSQLPTFKSRNKGSGRHYRRERYKEGKSY